ncbi:MAG: creatininase family protein [Roseitalea sp.]|nr:creatininase family protein [Roseitalea sp.]MBO6720465.1 creatininase family protein [Roseitalea sp.]MBO6743612.1 creatininase family protein [Roseitalea sp.]
MSENVKLAEHTWPEVEALLKRDPVAVIPVGAFEQHGHHLPLMVDAHMAGTVCEAAARKAQGDGTDIVVTPTVWTGYSPHHMGFPGSVTLDDDTFSAVVGHVARSLARHGFRRIAIINGHGGNMNLIKNLTQTLFYEHGIRAAAASYWDFALADLAAWRQSETGGIMHACEMETALMLATRPDLVRMDEAADQLLDRSTYFGADLLAGGSVASAATFRELSPSGVIGAPTLATGERGEALLETMVARLATFFADFATWPLGEKEETRT